MWWHWKGVLAAGLLRCHVQHRAQDSPGARVETGTGGARGSLWCPMGSVGSQQGNAEGL